MMLKPDHPQDQAQHAQHEDDAGRVEDQHQHAELSQRADAVLADREGDGAQHAQRRQPDDEEHDLEQDVRGPLDEGRPPARPRSPRKDDGGAEQDARTAAPAGYRPWRRRR